MFDLGKIEISHESSLRLKRAEKSDLDFINNVSVQETNRILQEAWHGNFKWKSWFEDVARAFEEDFHRIFLIEFRNVVVGYLWLNEEDRSIWITAIIINASWQRQKIGQRIMEFLIKEGRKEGKKFIELGVQKNNNAALNFYTKLGFKKYNHFKYINTDLLRLEL